MLIQSHETAADGSPLIRLLPALPKAWSTGSARGLRTRGGLSVDIDWQDGQVTRCRLHSAEVRQVQVEKNGKIETLITEKE